MISAGVVAIAGFAILAVVLGGAALAVRHRYLLVQVTGLSMAPAFGDGARVLVRRLRASEVRPGDVVVVRPATCRQRGANDPTLFLKRAVAVGGDPVPSDLTRRTIASACGCADMSDPPPLCRPDARAACGRR